MECRPRAKQRTRTILANLTGKKEPPINELAKFIPCQVLALKRMFSFERDVFGGC